MRAKLVEDAGDILRPKSKNDIVRDFKELHGVDYLELEETVKELNKYGIKAKLVNNEYVPIEIGIWEITRYAGGGGMGWGLGKTISKKYAEKIVETLSTTLGEFWKGYDEYKIEEGSTVATFDLTHEDALKLLVKVKNES